MYIIEMFHEEVIIHKFLQRICGNTEICGSVSVRSIFLIGGHIFSCSCCQTAHAPCFIHIKIRLIFSDPRQISMGTVKFTGLTVFFISRVRSGILFFQVVCPLIPVFIVFPNFQWKYLLPENLFPCIPKSSRQLFFFSFYICIKISAAKKRSCCDNCHSYYKKWGCLLQDLPFFYNFRFYSHIFLP